MRHVGHGDVVRCHKVGIGTFQVEVEVSQVKHTAGCHSSHIFCGEKWAGGGTRVSCETFNPHLSLPFLLLLHQVLICVTTTAIRLFFPLPTWIVTECLQFKGGFISVTPGLIVFLPFSAAFSFASPFGSSSVSFSFMFSVMKKKLSMTPSLFLFVSPALQLLSEEPVWACRWAVPLRRHSQPVCEGQRVPRQHRRVRAQRTCKFTHSHKFLHTVQVCTQSAERRQSHRFSHTLQWKIIAHLHIFLPTYRGRRFEMIPT